jgi:hypothetical protein
MKQVQLGRHGAFSQRVVTQGIPSRDEARIALILSLEFGVMLLLKLSNWKANGFRTFS